MAAYASLVSLMNIMQQIMDHPRLSASLDKSQIESLGEKVGFFLDFIESYNCHGVSKEAEELESQIASAAHAAEDVIESHIVDQILAGSTGDHAEQIKNLSHLSTSLDEKQIVSVREKISFLLDFIKCYTSHGGMSNETQGLESQIHAGSTEASLSCLIDLQIKEKVMKVKEERELIDQQPTHSMPAASSRPLSTGNTTMVGFDDELIQLMDLLTGQQPNRQIISIVGMGGIGKTTLARNVYEHSNIMQHFDVRAWGTISQEYSVKEILSEILSCQGEYTSGTIHELGEQLHKYLSGRRYLIILDDIWSIEAWDRIKFFFPDNGNGSRVVLTTRLSSVAIHCCSFCFEMNFLDEDKSWNLLCKKVFGHEDCPLELMNIGKEIAKLCKGLPLSITVIGGLLQKSYRTRRYWRNVAENINSILNSGENDQCLNVLSLSYSHLPAHLKPCFIYMGIFKEDCEIRVSEVINLWVAEGFLKANGAQFSEEIAKGYLKNLVNRNLILVGRHHKNGNIKTCRIHDLLRDLCVWVAEKEKFFCVVRARSFRQGIERERRIICHDSADVSNFEVFNGLQSASLARSLMLGNFKHPSKYRLLRVLNTPNECCRNSINLRFLHCFNWPSNLSLIWNLQTLAITGGFLGRTVLPIEIWKMPQLRHIKCNEISLPDPPPCDEPDDYSVLRNLQTLQTLVDFKWSEEACKRIPNMKKLHMQLWEGHDDDRLFYYLSNLRRLHELQSLRMELYYGALQYRLRTRIHLAFPGSLNKLSLRNWHLHLDDLRVIGSLPQLEVLNLEQSSYVGEDEWSPVDVKFCRLKFLRIHGCHLRCWTADGSDFPVLEKLVLQSMDEWDELPSGIEEVPTLELIRLEYCGESAISSAMRIREEQESLGNYDLQIQVWGSRSSP